MGLSILAWSQNGKISEDERLFLYNNWKVTTDLMNETINSISDEEWNRSAPDGGWTVAECFEHIILAMPRQIEGIQKSLAKETGEFKDLRAKDGFLLSKITDRGVKVKTPLEPKNGNMSKNEILEAYNNAGQDFLKILNDKKAQLRNHYGNSPYGEVDVYQLLIFIPGHVMRHLSQVKEILVSGKS